MRSLMALAFVCAGALGVARADVRDSRVISARAGGVNLVSGDVRVRRAASADWLALSTADELKGGDTVRTGPTGRVEILLNPGSYFRAGGGTEFTLAGADLEDLRVELARGAAVVEATGYGDMNLSIEVSMPGARVRVVRSGVYRFNAPAGGPAEVAVTKGRAVLGETLVKGGKVARVSGGGNVEVAKLDKEGRDEFDLWSRERGKELAKANEKLSHRAVRSAFSTGFDSMSGSWGSPNGFWFFNSALRCYTFLPYGYGWRSPYGYGYGTGIWRAPEPSGGRYPNYEPRTGGGGAASNPGGGTWGGGGSGGSGGAGSGGSGNGGGAGSTPMTPRHMDPPARIEPRESPRREKPIDPRTRPDQ